MKKPFCLLMSVMMTFFCSACAAGNSSSSGTSALSEKKLTNLFDQYAVTQQDIDVKAYGAKGDGNANDEEAVRAAIRAAEQEGKRLVFTVGEYRLYEAKLQFPKNITVVFQPGALLLLNGTSQLSFEAVFEAGNYPIFKGEGYINVSSMIAGNPMWFGAKGDGVTNDTEAFKAAWKIFKQLNVPYTEAGYVISSIDTFQNMVLEGVGAKKPILIATKNTRKMFNVASGGHFSVNNVEIRMADAPDYSAAFYFDTAKSYIEKVYITNCDFYDCYNVFTDARDKNVMMFMYFENLFCKDGRNSTFDIEDFEGFIFMKSITIDNSQSYTKHKIQDGFISVKIDDARGINFENMTVIGGNTGSENEIGFSHPGQVALMSALFWDNVTVKNMSGYGIVCGCAILSTFIDVNVLQCGGGIKLSGALEMQFKRVTVEGDPNSQSFLDGILIQNTDYTTLDQVVCKNTSGNGIRLLNSNYTTISNSTFSNNADRGFVGQGGKCNHLLNSTCTGNAEGQVSMMMDEKSLATDVVYKADGTKGSLSGYGRLE